ncbi:UNVERIFIED_CONTAM: hypothetical protein K2H54_067333 [Gekko kuhli]
MTNGKRAEVVERKNGPEDAGRNMIRLRGEASLNQRGSANLLQPVGACRAFKAIHVGSGSDAGVAAYYKKWILDLFQE